MVRVKGLVRPHDRDKIFGIGQVDNIVRVTGQHVHGFDLFAAHLEFYDLVGADLAFLNQGAAAHHDKEFPLGVVPMFALGDSRLGNVHAELAAVRRLQELGKAAAGVHVHLEREAHLFLGQVAQVGGIELLREAAVRDFGHHERLRLVVEDLQQVYDFAKLDLVDRRDVTVKVLGCVHFGGLSELAFAGHHVHSVEGAVVFPACQGGNHVFHQVVDVEQFHVHIRVVHLDGQVVGDIVAEGRHGTVVVRTAPLAEKIRETVNQNASAGLAAVIKEQFLPRFFAASVLAVAKTASQRSLNAAAEHYRALVAVLLKSVEQSARETEVPGHELAVVLGAVHSGEVEHEIGLGTVFVQLLRSRIDIVCVDLAHHEPRMGTVLAVADTLEGSHQVTPHKALGTSNEDIHLLPHLRKFFADVAQAKELFLDLFHVQELGVAGVEFRERVAFRVALAEVLVVIQAALVARNAVEVPEVDGVGAFLVGQERLVHLFAVADADDLDLRLVATE